MLRERSSHVFQPCMPSGAHVMANDSMFKLLLLSSLLESYNNTLHTYCFWNSVFEIVDTVDLELANLAWWHVSRRNPFEVSGIVWGGASSLSYSLLYVQ